MEKSGFSFHPVNHPQITAGVKRTRSLFGSFEILLSLLLGLVLLTGSACGVSLAASGIVSSEPPPSYTEPTSPSPYITSGAPPSSWDQNLAGYSFTVTADLGFPPYSFSVSGLPPGLSINSGTGSIGGIPTTTGIFPGTFAVTDQYGYTGTQPFAITINARPAVTSGALPAWDQNLAGYAYTLTASGGTPAYTFSASGLPTGLSISASTGIISGTPATAGSFPVTFTVTDSIGGTASQPSSITINANPSITSGAPGSPWIRDIAGYGFTLTATAGVPPYAFSASGLPTGLSIVAGTGIISGTPTAVGTFSGTFTVTDSIGGTGSQSFSIVIALPETTTPPTPTPTVTSSPTPTPSLTPTPTPTPTPAPSTTPPASSATALFPPPPMTFPVTPPPSNQSPVLPLAAGAIVIAGAAGAGLIFVRKARLRPSSGNGPPGAPQAKMSVLPRSDPGTQQLELQDPRAVKTGVRFIPVPDPGKQKIIDEEPGLK